MDFSNVNSVSCHNLLSFKYPNLYQQRFCDQEDFSIVICRGDNARVEYDRPFLLKKFESKVYLPMFLMPYTGYKLVSSISDLYVVGNHEVKRYSYSSKIWYKLSGSLYFDGCCICSFLQQLFVINWFPKFYHKLRNDWCSIAKMNELKEYAACTVFEGKIVVS